jgi:hypothetical protein
MAIPARWSAVGDVFEMRARSEARRREERAALLRRSVCRLLLEAPYWVGNGSQATRLPLSLRQEVLNVLSFSCGKDIWSWWHAREVSVEVILGNYLCSRLFLRNCELHIRDENLTKSSMSGPKKLCFLSEFAMHNTHFPWYISFPLVVVQNASKIHLRT